MSRWKIKDAFPIATNEVKFILDKNGSTDNRIIIAYLDEPKDDIYYNDPEYTVIKAVSQLVTETIDGVTYYSLTTNSAEWGGFLGILSGLHYQVFSGSDNGESPVAAEGSHYLQMFHRLPPPKDGHITISDAGDFPYFYLDFDATYPTTDDIGYNHCTHMEIQIDYKDKNDSELYKPLITSSYPTFNGGTVPIDEAHNMRLCIFSPIEFAGKYIIIEARAIGELGVELNSAANSTVSRYMYKMPDYSTYVLHNNQLKSGKPYVMTASNEFRPCALLTDSVPLYDIDGNIVTDANDETIYVQRKLS